MLTGAGDVFCLGGDYQGAGPTAAGRKAYAAALLRMDRAMAQLGKPLVAAVNGDAHAGGFSVVVACDLAVAADARDASGCPRPRAACSRSSRSPSSRTRCRRRCSSISSTRARLMSCCRSAVAAPRQRGGADGSRVLERAVERARAASAHRGPIVTLGRDLYYALRGRKPRRVARGRRKGLARSSRARE